MDSPPISTRGERNHRLADDRSADTGSLDKWNKLLTQVPDPRDDIMVEKFVKTDIMSKLRDLEKEIEATNWMYEKKK
jgi:hypothetical protein